MSSSSRDRAPRHRRNPPRRPRPSDAYRRRKLGVLLLGVGRVARRCSCSARCLADLLPLKDPNDDVPRRVAADGPSAEHWFGADNIGHDVFSRTIFGARRSLPVAGRSPRAIGFVVGGALGLIAGFYRRALDATIDGRAQHPAGHPRRSCSC